MSISILNNIPSLEAQNALSMTQMNLNNTLEQLSTGQRINSGADDAAGLAIANGLQANITALTQSVQNASDGVGFLQVADGALSQITTLLNRAVTLATEASTGTVSDTQRGALDAEFTSIKSEIDTIGGNTTYNGQAIFTNSTLTIFMSDSSAAGTTSVTVGMVTVDAGHL
jgi:flagellin